MELRQLRYFLAVARTLNFTRAAEEVHIAQPPLSRQIANLEDELGVQLLERGPRSLTLTPAGEFFADHAREILQRVQRLKVETAAMGDRGLKTMRIGVELSLLYGRAPLVMRNLRELDPGLRIELEVLPAERILTALQDGEVDVALGREVTHAVSIHQLVLRTEPLLLAYPAGHPPETASEEGLFLNEIVDETLILFSTTAAPEADVVKRLCDEAGIPATNRIVLHDIAAVLGLVAAGGGLAVVPSIATRLRSEDVGYIPLKDEKAEIPVVLSVVDQRHRAFFNAIHAEVLRLINEIGS